MKCVTRRVASKLRFVANPKREWLTRFCSERTYTESSKTPLYLVRSPQIRLNPIKSRQCPLASLFISTSNFCVECGVKRGDRNVPNSSRFMGRIPQAKTSPRDAIEIPHRPARLTVSFFLLLRIVLSLDSASSEPSFRERDRAHPRSSSALTV